MEARSESAGALPAALDKHLRGPCPHEVARNLRENIEKTLPECLGEGPNWGARENAWPPGSPGDAFIDSGEGRERRQWPR